MESFDFDQDKFLNPPEEVEHHRDCPMHEDSPKRPKVCICDKIREYLEDEEAERQVDEAIERKYEAPCWNCYNKPQKQDKEAE